VPSDAVIATCFGAMVLTAGAETVVEMLPAPSASALPKTPPLIVTWDPAVKPAPVIAICRLLTKHVPDAVIVAARAAAGAASATAAAASTAAERTFIW
jgi:hypothetical protein